MRFKRGLAGMASVACAVGLAALVPTTAQAHPCAVTWSLSTSTFLSANDSGTAWAGSLPTAEGNDADCAVVDNSTLTAELAQSDAIADDPIAATQTYEKSSNMTPVGYSARIPPLGTGSSLADINSDIAFKGNLAFQGHWSGFRVIDISDPKNPTQIYNTEACRHTSGQGDVVVHGNLLIRTWDSPNSTGANANATCFGHAVGTGFEGIHIFDISNPAAPTYVRQVRMAATGNEEGAPAVGCGAHTATGVPDDARGYLYLYVGGSSGTCNGIDIVRISLTNPTDAKFLHRASHGRSASCHDNNVMLNVGGTKVGYAMCAGGNGLAMYKFDMAKPAGEAGTPQSPGGVENPTLIWAKRMPDETTNPAVTTGHSGSFTYDGKLLIYGHEPGGGTGASCEATDSILFRSLFFMDPENGDIKGTFVQPRPQSNTENCTWHNFNVVPTYKGYYAVSGNYEMGISVFDFTNPQATQQIAYADPTEYTPGATNTNPTAGNWSTHYYNGRIYESDIRRGLLIWELDHDSMRRVRTPDMSNPQTQTTSFEQDLEGPTVTSTNEGQGYKLGSAQTAQFTCADSDSGVESCSSETTALDTSSMGHKTYTVTATDKAGNVTTHTVSYMINSADFPGGAGASVAATLALTMGQQAQFGALTPGVAREYTATSQANVVSTAGDALLTVSDADTTNTGKLVNGAFTLAQPMTASAASAGGSSATAAPVGGSSAPTSLLTYSSPVSNDAVTLTFKQSVGANEALRTGAYSKALTFTLSTTQP